MDKPDIKHEFRILAPLNLERRDTRRLQRALERGVESGMLLRGETEGTFAANPVLMIFRRVARKLRKLARESSKAGMPSGLPPETPEEPIHMPVTSTQTQQDILSPAPDQSQNALVVRPIGQNVSHPLIAQAFSKLPPGKLPIVVDYFASTSSRAVSRRTSIPKSTVYDSIWAAAARSPTGLQLSRRLQDSAPWGEGNSGRPRILALDAGFMGKKKRRQFVYLHVVDVLSHDPLNYFVGRSPDDYRGRSGAKAVETYMASVKRCLIQIRDVLKYQPIVVVMDLDTVLLGIVRDVFCDGKDVSDRCRIVGCFFHLQMAIYRCIPTRQLKISIKAAEKKLKADAHLLSAEKIAERKLEIQTLKNKKKRYEDLREQIEAAALAEDGGTQEERLDELRRVRSVEQDRIDKATQTRNLGENVRDEGDARVIQAIDVLLKHKQYFPPLNVLRGLGVTNRQINWQVPEDGIPPRETGPTNNVCEGAISELKRFWRTHKGYRTVRTFGKLVDLYWFLRRLAPESDGRGSR
jgi:hypothetical protein